MSGKYIVRQPIKDAEGNTIGHEILYHGANQAFSSDNSTSSAEFAAANTHLQFSNPEQPQGAEGNAELYDLHHHAADEEDPPAV